MRFGSIVLLSNFFYIGLDKTIRCKKIVKYLKI